MATQKTKVVVIHGSHHELVDGKRVKHEVGGELELHPDEIKRLDPNFRNGIGERFASPAMAAKLAQKKALEAELDQAEASEPDEPEADEDDGDDDEDPDEAPAAAPTPPAVAEKPKKKSKAKA